MIFPGGKDTVEKAYLLFKKIKWRFWERGFNLRKWRTNDRELRELIYGDDTTIKPSKATTIKPSSDSYDFIVIGRTFVLRIEKIIICN